MKIREASIRYKTVGETSSEKLDCPENVALYMQGAYDERPDQESFWVIGCDMKHKPKFRHMVTLGTLNQTIVHPREIFKPLILASCAFFAISHNHPSGDPSPSAADIKVTRQLREAAKVIGIQMLDHVIIGDSEFYSFQEKGLI